MTVFLQSDEKMRNRADWMVPSDDVILEMIEEYGNLTPRAIEELGGPVRGHAGDRCRELYRHGLLNRIARGLYELSDRGQRYLDGDIDNSELKPIPDRE